jgi:thymidine kinase
MPADHLTRIAAVIRIPPRRGGWLEVICGPMFSGKSEEMIRRLRRAEIAGQRVVIFKPQIDDRYDATDVVSHAGARMRAVPVTCVAELATHARGFDVVGIDEAQFLGDGVVESALDLADCGTRVIVAGLDQDFRRQPFGPMPELLSHAEFVDKLQAVCHRCGGPATTTQRLVDGQPAPYSGETVVVGAAEQYEARCRGCHEAGVGATLAAA